MEDPGGDLEFEHFLCVKLGYRTKQELRDTMSQAEFVEWNRYYAVLQQREQLAAMKAG